ncbi:MAG TPA: efflux RND transporter periplasmic adaptor subunit [Longimicrobiales bacterium]|nr:efflux RND transporter periplasmic adaptor subunit [Longimicrobiales bacterium]
MRKQIVVSVAIVAIAGAAVGVYALTDDGGSEAAGAASHNHGAAASSENASPVRLDPERARRIGVTYATAEAGPMASVVRTVGAITYDETHLVSVNPKIEGWVEKLFVDFTGAPVAKGQPLLAVYSPMLVAAQEELILARRLLDGAVPGGTASTNAQELLEASRRRLSYWDIPAADIARIERTGKPQKTLVLRAPASGLVVEKAVLQGQRIMPGMELYRIADLSTVWVEGEVFEKDLGLVTLGSSARISFDAYPGQFFSGKVTYVYPTITADSRTGRVRIALPNRNLQFKPGMYATMEFAVPVHATGIHIPRSAVLQTGERTMVFVRTADGGLEPRQITAGIATTEHIEVLSGLQEGEVVVASANFLVDAESNLDASMDAMQPKPAADPHAGHNQTPSSKPQKK